MAAIKFVSWIVSACLTILGTWFLKFTEDHPTDNHRRRLTKAGRICLPIAIAGFVLGACMEFAERYQADRGKVAQAEQEHQVNESIHGQSKKLDEISQQQAELLKRLQAGSVNASGTQVETGPPQIGTKPESNVEHALNEGSKAPDSLMSSSPDGGLKTNEIAIAVRVHPDILLSNLQATEILNRASEVVNSAYRRARPTSKRKEVVFFRLDGNVNALEPLSDRVLSQFTPASVNAIREEEGTGLYGRDAIEARMSSEIQHEKLQIDVVRSVVAPCPTSISPPSLAQLANEEFEYPWLACTALGGHISILRLLPKLEDNKADRWLNEQGVLWAHEICHQLGLEDLDASLMVKGVGRVPRGATGWLMAHPFDPSSIALLPLEADVIAAYPSNSEERGKAWRLSKSA